MDPDPKLNAKTNHDFKIWKALGVESCKKTYHKGPIANYVDNRGGARVKHMLTLLNFKYPMQTCQLRGAGGFKKSLLKILSIYLVCEWPQYKFRFSQQYQLLLKIEMIC